jgi:DNA mismatch endonuclease (patch repair protein)
MEKLLRKAKIRFRKHYDVAGTPDFALPERKVAIFVDGDFWHGYDYERRCKKLTEFWKTKIERSMARDRRDCAKLRRLGWKVVRVWEHDLERNPDKLAGRISRYAEAVRLPRSKRRPIQGGVLEQRGKKEKQSHHRKSGEARGALRHRRLRQYD